jgi:hypothetical protein
VVFSVQKGGSLGVSGSPAGVTVSGDGYNDIVVTGSFSNINAMLASNLLYYAPYNGYFGPEVLTITAQDIDDSFVSTTQHIPIIITSDYSGIVATEDPGGDLVVDVPDSQITTPGSSLELGGISIEGALATAEMHVQLQLEQGGNLAMYNPSGSGVLVTATSNANGIYGETLSGTLAAIDALLANVTSVMFTTPDNVTTGPDGLLVYAYQTSTDLLPVEPGGNVVPILMTPPVTNSLPAFAVTASTALTASPSEGVTRNGPAGVYAELASEPQHGFVQLTNNGGFTYTPVPGYVGPDSFSYYGWDDFTESLVSQTVLLAVGGDGGQAGTEEVITEALNVDVSESVRLGHRLQLIGNHPRSSLSPDNGLGLPMPNPASGQQQPGVLERVWAGVKATFTFVSPPVFLYRAYTNPGGIVQDADTATGGRFSSTPGVTTIPNDPYSRFVASATSEPGSIESLIPIYGSVRNLMYNANNGNWAAVSYYAGMAVLDAFVVRSIITGGARLFGRGALVAQNRLAGNNFRNEIVNLLRQAGFKVNIEVFKPTPLGARYIDIEVYTAAGKLLGGIETKLGTSQKTIGQVAKDLYLWIVHNYRVDVVRGPLR